MLQKVAAIVVKVAADLCFMACEVRWMLIKIFFTLAATSAASFVCLYIFSNAVFSAFQWFCAEDWRFWRVKWHIQHAGSVVFTKLPAWVYFFEKSFLRAKIVPNAS